MRKHKLIKRLPGPIIMFLTTQGVAGEMSTITPKKEIILKDLELFTKSL